MKSNNTTSPVRELSPNEVTFVSGGIGGSEDCYDYGGQDTWLDSFDSTTQQGPTEGGSGGGTPSAGGASGGGDGGSGGGKSQDPYGPDRGPNAPGPEKPIDHGTDLPPTVNVGGGVTVQPYIPSGSTISDPGVGVKVKIPF